MHKIVAMITVISLAVNACGGSTDSDSGDPAAAPTTVAPTTTTAPPTTTTAAPTTTTAAPVSAITPGEDPDVDAVVVAYSIAFDSEADYAAKEGYIVDPTGLEQTVVDYLAIGETMGGVSVLVNEVVIDGDSADVTYDLLFNGNPTYPNLSGTAVLTDSGWQVPRSVFCSLMASARVGCPTE